VIGVEAIRREEFPITRDGVYFEHATFGPLPRRHVRAVSDFLTRMSEQGLPDLFAIFLECGPDAIGQRVLALSRRLVLAIQERGFEVVVGPHGRKTRSAVISVALGEDQTRRFRAACERHRVRCAVRESRGRLSPHFYKH
jgi:hypothetical protein